MGRRVARRTKKLGYAYFSSPLATELGHGATGCWYAAETDYYDDGTERDRVFCSAVEQANVLSIFDANNLPVDRWSQPFRENAEKAGR